MSNLQDSNERKAARGKSASADLKPAPPEVLVLSLQTLTKQIHRAASLRQKLDLLALQNEIVGALVIGR